MAVQWPGIGSRLQTKTARRLDLFFFREIPVPVFDGTFSQSYFASVVASLPITREGVVTPAVCRLSGSWPMRAVTANKPSPNLNITRCCKMLNAGPSNDACQRNDL